MARLESFDLGEDGATSRLNCGGSALLKWLGSSRVILIRDGHGLEPVELGPEVHCGPESEITLREGY